MLNSLLQQVVVEFDVKYFFKSKFHIFVLGLAFFTTFSNVSADDQVKIIERDNFQKRIRVLAMTDKTTGQLKDYITFNFYVNKQLIFCHMSKDHSEPTVICH